MTFDDGYTKWMPIETEDLIPAETNVDLFGYIPYDLMEMRLTDCEKINGVWHYFQAGDYLDIKTLGFTPTHWRCIPKNPSDE